MWGRKLQLLSSLMKSLSGFFANKKVKTKEGEECKDRHFQRGNRNPEKILSLIVRLGERRWSVEDKVGKTGDAGQRGWIHQSSCEYIITSIFFNSYDCALGKHFLVYA